MTTSVPQSVVAPSAAARKRLPRSGGRGKGLQPASLNLFYVPALAILLVFTAYPLVSGIQLSFTNWDGFSLESAFVGLENYARIFGDPAFRTVLINTFIYGIGSTIIQQVLGLGLAVALNRKSRLNGALRAVIYLPVLVSPVIMGTMYYFLFQYNNGALNSIIGLFGGAPVAWFNDEGVSIAIIVIVNSLQFVGTSMIIYLAGLQSIPEEVQEAASLDGASGWKSFRHITLPLLQPALATSVVLNLVGGLKLFDVIKVLTGGGPGYSTNSLSSYISVVYFNNQAAGYASAMGVVLFLIILVFTVVVNRGLNRNRLEA